MPPAEPFPVRAAEVVEVIRITALTGSGGPRDSSREVDQYFNPQGGYLFKVDVWAEEEERLRSRALEKVKGAAAKVSLAWLELEKRMLADTSTEGEPATRVSLVPDPLAAAIGVLLFELKEAAKEGR